MEWRRAASVPEALTVLFALGGAAAVIAYTLATYLVGRVATARIAQGTGLPAVLAAPLGASAVGLELWALGALGIPWNPVTLSVAPALVVVAARARLLQALRDDLHGARDWWRDGRLDRTGRNFVLLALALFLSLCLWALVAQPLEGNDAVAIWMFKAKLYLAQQRVDLAAVIGEPGRNLDYPPLYSLFADTVYVAIGGVSDNLGKAVAFPFVMTAALTMLVATRGSLGLRTTGIFLMTLASLPLALNQVFFSGEMGYADYAIAALIMVVVASVARAEKTGDPSGYHLALLAAGVAAMLKNEGQMLLLTTALIAGFRLARTPGVRSRSMLIAGIAVAPVLVWKLFAAMAGYRGQTDAMPAVSFSDLPSRANSIFSFGLHTTSFSTDFGWILVAAVLVLEFAIVNRSLLSRAAVVVVAAQAAAYFINYLFTRFDLLWQLTSSYDRLALQVTPALVLLLALGASVPADNIG